MEDSQGFCCDEREEINNQEAEPILEDSQLVHQTGATRQKRTETGKGHKENEAKNKHVKQNLGMLSGFPSSAVQYGSH